MCDLDLPLILLTSSQAEQGGVKVKVIAGSSLGVQSPVRTRSPTMYLDFTLQPQTEFTQDIPNGWNAFVYTLSGFANFGQDEVTGPAHHTLLLKGTTGPLKVVPTLPYPLPISLPSGPHQGC